MYKRKWSNESETVMYRKGIENFYFQNCSGDNGGIFQYVWNQLFCGLRFEIEPVAYNCVSSRESILGGNQSKVIVLKNFGIRNCPFPGSFCAVFDQLDPFRVFVGHTVEIASNSMAMLGGIICFDESGEPVG